MEVATPGSGLGTLRFEPLEFLLAHQAARQTTLGLQEETVPQFVIGFEVLP